MEISGLCAIKRSYDGKADLVRIEHDRLLKITTLPISGHGSWPLYPFIYRSRLHCAIIVCDGMYLNIYEIHDDALVGIVAYNTKTVAKLDICPPPPKRAAICHAINPDGDGKLVFCGIYDDGVCSKITVVDMCGNIQTHDLDGGNINCEPKLRYDCKPMPYDRVRNRHYVVAIDRPNISGGWSIDMTDIAGTNITSLKISSPQRENISQRCVVSTIVRGDSIVLATIKNTFVISMRMCGDWSVFTGLALDGVSASMLSDNVIYMIGPLIFNDLRRQFALSYVINMVDTSTYLTIYDDKGDFEIRSILNADPS